DDGRAGQRLHGAIRRVRLAGRRTVARLRLSVSSRRRLLGVSRRRPVGLLRRLRLAIRRRLLAILGRLRLAWRWPVSLGWWTVRPLGRLGWRTVGSRRAVRRARGRRVRGWRGRCLLCSGELGLGRREGGRAWRARHDLRALQRLVLGLLGDRALGPLRLRGSGPT